MVKCDSCGEKKAVWAIGNPNYASLKEHTPWFVCTYCTTFLPTGMERRRFPRKEK